MESLASYVSQATGIACPTVESSATVRHCFCRSQNGVCSFQGLMHQFKREDSYKIDIKYTIRDIRHFCNPLTTFKPLYTDEFRNITGSIE